MDKKKLIEKNSSKPSKEKKIPFFITKTFQNKNKNFFPQFFFFLPQRSITTKKINKIKGHLFLEYTFEGKRKITVSSVSKYESILLGKNLFKNLRT